MNFHETYYLIIDRLHGTYTGSVLREFFHLLKLVGPYFMIALLLNVVFRYYLLKHRFIFTVQKEKLSILLAGFAGLLSPLPTYIAVPLGFSLISVGLPFSAAVAFMVASPLLNPGIFFLTWIQLGWMMALARLISAFVLALVAGFLSGVVKKSFKKITIPDQQDRIEHKRPFGMELYRSFLFMGKYFAVAVLIGACVKAMVPEETVSRILGGNAHASLIVAVALGVPFYSCGGAAIPLIQVLGEMGMNPGAALAFFISGPSTKLETLYTYHALLGSKALVFFLCFTLIGSFAFGTLFLKISTLFIR